MFYGTPHVVLWLTVLVVMQVPPGTEGTISLEGTLAGVGGSLIIVAFSFIFYYFTDGL